MPKKLVVFINPPNSTPLKEASQPNALLKTVPEMMEARNQIGRTCRAYEVDCTNF